MGDFLAAVIREASSLPIAELAALLLGIAYLLLAIRESIWCWLCAFISSSIFAVVFAGAQIYMDSALQVFYAAMAVYGAWTWSAAGGPEKRLPVTTWPVGLHLVMVAIVVAGAGLSGRALEAWTDAAYPYVDSFTTFASLWATFLVARKVLENWWYWLVIDGISIGIYLERGLNFAALLFLVYLIMIPFGLLAWTRSYRQSGAIEARV